MVKKELLYFSKDKYSKDWYTWNCKECRAIINKKWRDNNREYVNKIAIDNYYKNRLSKIDYSRNYKLSHDEQVKKYCKNYRKQYNQRDYVKVKYRIYGSSRRRIIRNKSDWSINLYTLNELLLFQNNCCNICNISLINYKDLNWNDWKHLDHIHPLSKWGSHTIWNVQWLCWSCNLKKSDKYENILN